METEIFNISTKIKFIIEDEAVRAKKEYKDLFVKKFTSKKFVTRTIKIKDRA